MNINGRNNKTISEYNQCLNKYNKRKLLLDPQSLLSFFKQK